MKLIVGLGNPELRYMTTRHNAGFWIVEKIATTYGATFNRSASMQADVAKTTIEGEQVVLAKPVTYMNLSGRAVQAVLHWYKIPVENCLVVHDDVALPLGKIRFQQGAGAGGQHGVESIIEMLGGNKSFSRLKFGVGPDPGGDRRADYVLSAIPDAERDLKEKCIALAVDGLMIWLKQGCTTAANKFNGEDLRPQPEPQPKPATAAGKDVAAGVQSENSSTFSSKNTSDKMSTAESLKLTDVYVDTFSDKRHIEEKKKRQTFVADSIYSSIYTMESTKPQTGGTSSANEAESASEALSMIDDKDAIIMTAADMKEADSQDEEIDAPPPAVT